MPTPTYDLIASTTVAASASEVVFGSLPQTYRDLILIVQGSMGAATGVIRFNGDSGANYTRVGMYGDGSTAASYSDSTAGVFNTTIVQVMNIMDYSATDKHKTYIFRDNIASSLVVAQVGRWANTTAISTVALISSSSTFVVGTTVALYGIAS
jgi:hypothetical protein